MSNQIESGNLWSDELGRRVVSSVPDKYLVRQWGAHGSNSSDGGAAPASIRDELLEWAREDTEVRRWMIRTWREAHPEVVAAVDHTITEGIASKSVQLLDQFEAEDVLLALLTDEFEDGSKLVQSFIKQATSVTQRQALLALLQRLTGSTNAPPRSQARVVILGGKPRDESRLRRRLFANTHLAVRWKTFEKKQGGDAVEKDVIGALRHADAVIIITGMASHILVQIAKEFAKRSGIAWTCIEKASDKQVTSALQELLPGSVPPVRHFRKSL